jgi:ribonucleoside-diphosphate reductase alpha chain
MHSEKTYRTKKVIDYYKQASNGDFTLATPVLGGLGSKTKQFSSCVLIKADDTLDSIYAAGEMVAKYSAKRAGIGLEIGRIRAAGAPIRNGEIAHTGLTLFIKM